jgi:hypothetical protein
MPEQRRPEKESWVVLGQEKRYRVHEVQHQSEKGVYRKDQTAEVVGHYHFHLTQICHLYSTFLLSEPSLIASQHPVCHGL